MLATWCLLVFVLVILHLALMTREHHRDTTEAPHTDAPSLSAVPAISSLSAMPDHGDHDTPRSTLDGCPVGQAVLPLLLLLLGTVGAYVAHRTLSAPAASSAVRRAPPIAPPPLPAAQRRALLQTFII